MKNFLIASALILGLATSVEATVLPSNVEDFVKKSFPEAQFRFDGVIVLPDGTVYLPLIPSKLATDTAVNISSTYPSGRKMEQKPDAVILSNDYVLLKMITNSKGRNTVINLTTPPVEMRTGLLPQDMLVPKNLVIPSSLKGIIGNLNISTTRDVGLVIPVTQTTTQTTTVNLNATPQLKGKDFYITSNTNKNIQVVSSDKSGAKYALFQEDAPVSMKGYEGFLLITSYGKKSLEVISLADEKVIKEIDFPTRPEEIIIDAKNKLAYVSSGEDATMYVVSLENMSLKKQIRLNGMCEKVILSDDGTKIFYNDKQTNGVWVIELDNEYLLKEIGKFPNVSKLGYVNGKIYITSRTKNRLAIIDYETMGLMSENEIGSKPVDIYAKDGVLYILCAGDKVLNVIDTETDTLTSVIELSDNSFPTKITPVDGTDLALITDARAGVYAVLDTKTQKIVSVNSLNVPVGSIYVTDKVKKIGSK